MPSLNATRLFWDKFNTEFELIKASFLSLYYIDRSSVENRHCHVNRSFREHQNFRHGLAPQQASLRARVWLNNLAITRAIPATRDEFRAKLLLAALRKLRGQQ